MRRSRRCHAAFPNAREGALSDIPIGVVTISDRASQGVYDDKGGPGIEAALMDLLASRWRPARRLVPDERPAIEAALIALADDDRCPLILTTGGTGPRSATSRQRRQRRSATGCCRASASSCARKACSKYRLQSCLGRLRALAARASSSTCLESPRRFGPASTRFSQPFPIASISSAATGWRQIPLIARPSGRSPETAHAAAFEENIGVCNRHPINRGPMSAAVKILEPEADVRAAMRAIGGHARAAARELASAPAEQKDLALTASARALRERSADILAANARDLAGAGRRARPRRFSTG